MPHTICTHCNVSITDHSTMVEQGGMTFCCTNCMAAETGQMRGQQATATCAHCQTPIVDQTTQAEQRGMTFCCNNCAAAMAAGASHR